MESLNERLRLEIDLKIELYTERGGGVYIIFDLLFHSQETPGQAQW